MTWRRCATSSRAPRHRPELLSLHREPGGNRIEAFTGPGYFIYEPDREPVRWTTSEGPGSYYGREIPIEFSARATPRVPEEERLLQAAALSGAAH